MKSIVAVLLYIGLAQTNVSGPSQPKPKIPARLYPTIEASVDRNVIFIGDVITLTITITHDPEVEIVARGRDFDLGKFEIKDIQPGTDKELPDGKMQRTDVYRLSTYFTGIFDIPPLDIRFSTKDGRIDTLRTSPIQIVVKSLTPEESENLQIRDIKPQELPEGQSWLWMYILIGVAVLVSIAVALWLRHRYKSGPRAVSAPPPLPAHEQAYRALEALRQRTELIEQKQYKLFSIEVSEILRMYMYNRWGIMAMDETSYEMMREVEKLSVNNEVKQLFRDFFDACDLMKFAKHEPGSAMFDHLIDKVKHVVDVTKQTTDVA